MEGAFCGSFQPAHIEVIPEYGTGDEEITLCFVVGRVVLCRRKGSALPSER